MDQEIEFQLLPEQIEAMHRAVAVLEAVWDALMEMARALQEAIHKGFDFIFRSWTHLQLLEWRLPPLMAKSVSEKVPAWLAFRIGYHWFLAKCKRWHRSVTFSG